MKIEELNKVFKYKSAIEFDEYLLFDDLELFDSKNSTSVFFNDTEELRNYKLSSGKTIEETIKDIEVIWEYRGGRGAGEEMGGGFSGAGGAGGDIGEDLYPAEFNKQGRFANRENAIQMFEQKYKNADKEYGITIDTDGFVHAHRSGGKSEVHIAPTNKQQLVVHNHPSGGAFSDTDLLTMSATKNASGIVATGTNPKRERERFTVLKTNKFDAKGFAKAVKKAKWPKRLDYNDGATWWLKKNQNKYGYTFSRKKLDS